ncbi:hypothetical protein [Lichenifustis flavocetrariae]|uniref:Uncharacterized protein n=1 Tax=Lichenifustis flavocetrariae TaxID=2949735 RepID=A0AA42CIK8_9HYPH|nr:hypothetical protein [Lichenifustis flavocetrariae]MCW6508494.1 hypothetical protein [Lichenifustis flavocetrariae]
MVVDDAEVVFTVDQVAEANTALRTALGRPPENFTMAQFIAMVSDEIDQLRGKGWGDAEIASLLAESTGSIVTADSVSLHYAPVELRGAARPT